MSYILVQLEEAVIRLFADTGSTTESIPDTKVDSVIQTLVNMALPKGFQSSTVYLSVKEAVHKYVPETSSVDALVTELVDVPAFTVPVAKFVNH